MYSFYGGQPGKNFEISQIFPNKVEVEKDLAKRWQSPIMPGEFILISYGSQHITSYESSFTEENSDDTQYNTNFDIDFQKYKKSYNASLWEKIYLEDPEKNFDDYTGIETIFISPDYGLGYKLIAILTGNTPKITGSSEPIDSGSDPYLEVDVTNKDNPIFKFFLPKTQVLGLQDTIVLNANEMPSVSLNDDDINNPYLIFSLPQSQNIKLGDINAIDADQDPNITLNEENINEPKINFFIPKSQVLGLKNTIVLNADEEPSVNLDETDINNPYLTFSLPQSQILDLGETFIIGPKENPTLQIDKSNINQPLLKFSLPRSVQFVYGNLLGESSIGIYSLNSSENPEIAEMKIGDYYINKNTGFIYILNSISESLFDFQYIACLSAPIPKVTYENINPFTNKDGTYQNNNPSVESSYENEEEKTGWQLNYSLPNLPNFKAEINFCGAEEEGKIIGAIQDETNYLYKFTIPTGSRLFSGNQIFGESSSVTIENAQAGDYYLNTDLSSISNGFIYKFNGSIWEKSGSIKGTTGKALNIIASYYITSSEAENTISAVGSYIESQLGRKPNEDELIAITYFENPDEIAYWYYYVNDKWGCSQLTGGLSSILQNEYDSTNDTNTTYTVSYINSLIVNTDSVNLDEQKRKTYSVSKTDEKLTQLKNEIIEMLTWGSF